MERRKTAEDEVGVEEEVKEREGKMEVKELEEEEQDGEVADVKLGENEDEVEEDVNHRL